MSFIKGRSNIKFQVYGKQFSQETSRNDPTTLDEDNTYLGVGAFSEGLTSGIEVGEQPRMELLCDRSIPNLTVDTIIKVWDKRTDEDLGNFRIVGRDHGRLLGKVAQVQRVVVVHHMFDTSTLS